MSHLTRFIRSVVSLSGALSLCVLCLALPARAVHSGCEEGVNTRPVMFTVDLGQDHTYQIAGYLYWHGQLEGKVLQLALHGGTYNHKYWDADELHGHDYSYARYMACHGFAVLALYNLGTGGSSQPEGDAVTIPLEAATIHQILHGLRGGAAVGTSFRKIVLVGHSLGSLESVFTQGTYNDADALVVTGWLNTPNEVDPATYAALFVNPYVVVPPWMRTLMFYAGNFDPAMPDYDNDNLADHSPRGLWTYARDATAGRVPTHSDLVRGPVLVVLDEEDLLMPISLASGEPAMYPNASSVTIHTVPGIGHDLNLHLANTEEWARMKSWIREAVDGGAGDDAD